MESEPPTNLLSPELVPNDSVLCKVGSVDELRMIVRNPAVLEQIGFTGVVIPEGLVDSSASLDEYSRQIGLSIYRENESESIIKPVTWEFGANVLWSSIGKHPAFLTGSDFDTKDTNSWNEYAVTLLLLMSLQSVPIVPVQSRLLYAPEYREQRELLRSLVFWRKRFGIGRLKPNLVHAGENGLLLFTIDSWLISINHTSEEIVIDLNRRGSMWLMLATDREVQLHGSELILSPFSGAVLANELAR